MMPPFEHGPEGPEFEITEREARRELGHGYYVLFMRMRGNKGEWLRLHFQSDYFPRENESLVCDLEDWR